VARSTLALTCKSTYLSIRCGELNLPTFRHLRLSKFEA
jgi:hypothetical protein